MFASLLIISVCLIRNLLDKQQDVNSDGEEEDEFVPSKKELQSSSEDEEEEKVELDSDEEVVLKKGRRATAGSRTPRSKQKSRLSTRTPRKTPKKVRDPCVQKRREVTPSSPDRPLPVLTGHTQHATHSCSRHSQHPGQVTASPTAC